MSDLHDQDVEYVFHVTSTFLLLRVERVVAPVPCLIFTGLEALAVAAEAFACNCCRDAAIGQSPFWAPAGPEHSAASASAFGVVVVGLPRSGAVCGDEDSGVQRVVRSDELDVVRVVGVDPGPLAFGDRMHGGSPSAGRARGPSPCGRLGQLGVHRGDHLVERVVVHDKHLIARLVLVVEGCLGVVVCCEKDAFVDEWVVLEVFDVVGVICVDQGLLAFGDRVHGVAPFES